MCAPIAMSSSGVSRGQASLAARVQGPPSVRAVWHGAESYVIGRRTLCVDEDSYLVINGGREYCVLAHRRDAVESLTIFFSSETRRAYETKNCDREFFAEHLRPHDERCYTVSARAACSLSLRNYRQRLVCGPDTGFVREPRIGRRRTASQGRCVCSRQFAHSNRAAAAGNDSYRLRELELHERCDAGRHRVCGAPVQVSLGAFVSHAARRFARCVLAPEADQGCRTSYRAIERRSRRHRRAFRFWVSLVDVSRASAPPRNEWAGYSRLVDAFGSGRDRVVDVDDGTPLPHRGRS